MVAKLTIYILPWSCRGECVELTCMWKEASKESMISLRKNIAIQMMKNVLDDHFVPRQPLRGPIMRGASSVSAGEGMHGLGTWPHFTSHWLGSTWKRAKDKYQKTTCTCQN